MSQFKSHLHSLAFEIKYASGFLYVDRCGQTLIDIEKGVEGWCANTPDLNAGVIAHNEKQFRAEFNTKRFNFFVKNADEYEISSIAEEVKKIWGIIQANLGLDDYTRIGYRPEYILPTYSLESAEKKLNQSKFKIAIPDRLINGHYEIKSQDIDATFANGEVEYHVQLHSVIETAAIDPSVMFRGDIRALPKNQKKMRIKQMKELKQYTANPMFAIKLDIDCIKYQPKKVAPDNFIKEQTKIIEKDFLPILKEL